MNTDNLRIVRTRPLIAPAILAEDIPQSEASARLVENTRTAVSNIVHGTDNRLLVVVGPCSIHDPDAAIEYAQRLQPLARELSDRAVVVMRVYFEKPRTTVGWKGYINDPRMDESFRVNDGLRGARALMAHITDLGLPTATEFLDTTLGQYYTEFVCWGAIGARTVESQVHRQLASGLSMPVGIKNRTDGNIEVALDAMVAAASPHLFPSLTKEGAPALLETRGNPDCHLVLRGGNGTNYDLASVRAAHQALLDRDLHTGIVVDCSHGNSDKQPDRQLVVARAVAKTRQLTGSPVVGIMLESHLVAGRQDIGPDLVYGQSITDACIDFAQTRELLLEIAGG